MILIHKHSTPDYNSDFRFYMKSNAVDKNKGLL